MARSRALAQVTDKVALWGDRWPVIAKQSCIDLVAAADDQVAARARLPCDGCEKRTECLTGKRVEIGPIAYDREIQTQPRASESTLFPRTRFEDAGALLDDESCVGWWRKPFGVEDRYGLAIAWDIAWSETVGGDWLVMMVGVVDRVTGRRRLLDIERWQGLSFKKQCQLIIDRWEHWNSDVVVIESDAAQQVWATQVRDSSAVPVLQHAAGGRTSHAGKRDLQLGVPGLLLDLEAKLWHFPTEDGGYHSETVEAFLSECEAFTMVDGKLEGVGEHDDTVMCWWHLAWALRLLVGSGWSDRVRSHRNVVPGARA